MDNDKLIEISIVFGIGIIGFLLNLIELIIDNIRNKEPISITFPGTLLFFMLCLIPPIGWITTIFTIIRQLNYIFHFYDQDTI